MKLSDKAYNFLKWAGLILAPALATLIGVVGKVWGMPYVDSIVTTVNAIGVFIGAIIGISSANYYSKQDEGGESGDD